MYRYPTYCISPVGSCSFAVEVASHDGVAMDQMGKSHAGTRNFGGALIHGRPFGLNLSFAVGVHCHKDELVRWSRVVEFSDLDTVVLAVFAVAEIFLRIQQEFVVFVPSYFELFHF